jgi:hypothetical protein
VWKDTFVANDDYILVGNECNFMLLPLEMKRDFDKPTRFTALVAKAIKSALNAKEIEDGNIPVAVTFTVLKAMESERGFTY